MGIQINGQTDRISAVDGSFSIQDLAEVNVTGVATASNFKTGTSNVHSTGYECANINATGIVTAASANFTGNVSVGGTLTYQDVTNIDSVGVITARAGVDVNNGHIVLDSGYSLQWSDSHERIEQSDGKLEFFTNNTEKVTISGESLGIGDASPTKPLTVGTTTPVILLDDQSSRTLEIRGPSTTHSATVLTTSVHDLLLGTNNAERLRITSAGKIGINETSPFAELDITSTTETTTGTLSQHGIRLSAPGAADGEVIPITGGFLSSQDRARAGIGFISRVAGSSVGYAGAIGFYTRSSADGNGLLRTDEKVRINESGTLIVDAGGDAQDIQIISHSGGGGHGRVYLRGNASNESSSIQLNHYGHADYYVSAGRVGNGLFSITRTNGGSDGIIMDSSGNMGLGVTPIAPGNTALHIGETTASQPVRLHMTTATTGATASDGFTLSIDGSSSVVNMIQREDAAIQIYTNNTERVTVDNNGMVVNNGYRISNNSSSSTSLPNPYSLGNVSTATIPSYPHFTGMWIVTGAVPCNNTWYDLLHSINDSNGLFHGYSGDASSKNIFQYQYSLTSPAYGVNNLVQRFMTGAWNTGSVSFQLRNNSGPWTLQIKATSHYNSNNNAGFKIMFHSYY